jgi:hypothetical protein
VKRVALFLLPLAAACASLRGGSEGGAASPTAAIERFLDAAKRRDLAAMEQVWGTDKGLAGKSMNRKELERRELIMMQCLHHEKSSLGASGPSEGGRLRIPVQVTLGDRRATPMFTVIRGPGSRWYVENFEIDQLRDQGFCNLPAATQKP